LNRDREKLGQTMKERKNLAPEELSRAAADRHAALGGKDGAPKKRRKMSAAWKTMIAVTERARLAKGERKKGN
jgi:hypothetical protein